MMGAKRMKTENMNYLTRKTNTILRNKQREEMLKMNYLNIENQCLWHKSSSITPESSCYKHCHEQCDGKAESCDTDMYIRLKDIPNHIAQQYIKSKK